MPTQSAEVAYGFVDRSFESCVGQTGQPFGRTSGIIYGVSDGIRGVQWNIAVHKITGETWLGVNLEGMAYDNWPIATFIKHELRTFELLRVDFAAKDAGDIWVALSRDAWQASTRRRIREHLISGSEVKYCDLTAVRWHHMLEEAYACLDPARRHRGRATQAVTFLSGEVQTMEVSPHLNIHTRLWAIPPSSEQNARSLIAAAHHLLQPIHEIVTNQAR